MGLDLVINSVKWGIIGGLVFLLGVIVAYGGTHVVLGVFQGTVWCVVLGFMLVVATLTLLDLLITFVIHWFNMED